MYSRRSVDTGISKNNIKSSDQAQTSSKMQHNGVIVLFTFAAETWCIWEQVTHVVSFHNQGQNCKKLDDGTFFLSGFEVLQGPNYALAQMMRCLIAWCSSWPCLVNADVDGSHVGLPENRLPIIAPECAVSSSCSKVETAMLGKKIHHFQTHPGHLRKEEPQHVGFPAPKIRRIKNQI